MLESVAKFIVFIERKFQLIKSIFSQIHLISLYYEQLEIFVIALQDKVNCQDFK